MRTVLILLPCVVLLAASSGCIIGEVIESGVRRHRRLAAEAHRNRPFGKFRREVPLHQRSLADLRAERVATTAKLQRALGAGHRPGTAFLAGLGAHLEVLDEELARREGGP